MSPLLILRYHTRCNITVVLTHANTNLIASFHKFADIYSEGNAVVLTQLGFSKTFEMVPHSKLLAKIEKM